MRADNVTVNRARYLAWLRQDFPMLYWKVASPVITNAKVKGLAGFLDTLVGGFKSVVTTVTKALPDLAKTYVEYDVQKRLIEANTKRAAQGLPPVMYDAQGKLIVAGGIPYTQADLQMAQAQMNAPIMIQSDNTLLWVVGGIGLLTVVLLSRNSGR